MGTTERREREKQRRRDDILNTAKDLFFDKGFRDTTIDDIARLAELARGTIYLYFENKEEIYATILEDGLDKLLNLMRESYHDEADALTNILAGHDAFMAFHDLFPQYYNVLMLDKLQISDVLPPELKTRLDNKTTSMAELIASMLQRGIEEGLFRPMPVREVAYLQIGMAMGFAQMLDKCSTASDVFTDREQSRQAMHAIIANSLIHRREID
jgi:TetR/AcrR family transcriptional regulator